MEQPETNNNITNDNVILTVEPDDDNISNDTSNENITGTVSDSQHSLGLIGNVVRPKKRNHLNHDNIDFIINFKI